MPLVGFIDLGSILHSPGAVSISFLLHWSAGSCLCVTPCAFWGCGVWGGWIRGRGLRLAMLAFKHDLPCCHGTIAQRHGQYLNEL